MTSLGLTYKPLQTVGPALPLRTTSRGLGVFFVALSRLSSLRAALSVLCPGLFVGWQPGAVVANCDLAARGNFSRQNMHLSGLGQTDALVQTC